MGSQTSWALARSGGPGGHGPWGGGRALAPSAGGPPAISFRGPLQMGVSPPPHCWATTAEKPLPQPPKPPAPTPCVCVRTHLQVCEAPCGQGCWSRRVPAWRAIPGEGCVGTQPPFQRKPGALLPPDCVCPACPRSLSRPPWGSPLGPGGPCPAPVRLPGRGVLGRPRGARPL